jgi:hypothetical protein
MKPTFRGPSSDVMMMMMMMMMIVMTEMDLETSVS